MTGLLHRRDLVALAARRRHGKTSLLTHLAVALAVPLPDFLGYEIPQPRRSLLLILEDDPGDYQEKLRRVLGQEESSGRVKIVFRDDFYEAVIPIEVSDQGFQDTVLSFAREHRPDLIVIDNLAHIIGAEYNDPKRVHSLMTWCYQLAKQNNCAIVLAAHPKKEDPEYPIRLEKSPARFFESIMGTSHFVNSVGNLWGLERPENEDSSTFVGGRQRSEGHQGSAYIYMDDSGRFRLLPSAERNLPLVLNTPVREHAWDLLPDPPASFGYREGERLVKNVMRSLSSYANWLRECRRLGVIVETPDGRLRKAAGAENGRSSRGREHK